MTAALTVGVLAVTACGGEDESDVATLRPSVNQSASSPIGDEGSAFDAALRFARCMRERGVDVPDPNDSGLLVFVSKQNLEDPDFPQAQDECSHLLPPDLWDTDFSPQEEARRYDQAVRYTDCMRQQGIDLPDPQPGGPHLGLAPGVDPDDPDFLDAEEICARHLQGTR